MKRAGLEAWRKAVVGAAAVCMVAVSTAEAATLWWDGDGLASNRWMDAASWNLAADGSGGDPATVPGVNDMAVFNTTVLNTDIVAALAANVTVSGLVFNSAGTTYLSTTGVNRRLFISEGGITINPGAGTVTFGLSTDTWRIPLSLRATATGSTQTWANNSANLFALNPQNTIITTNQLAAWVLTGTNDMSFAGVISGSGTNIVKTGLGTVTFTAANTFAGTTGVFTLAGGRVRVGNNSALSSATLILEGGTLSGNSSAARTLANPYVLAGDLALGHAVDTGALTLTGAGTLTGNRTITVDSSVTLGGSIHDGGSGHKLTKTGAATLTLAGFNTYSGGTDVQAGTLTLANTGAKPAGGTVTVAAGAALALAVDDGNPFLYWSTADIDALWNNQFAGVDLHTNALIGIDTTPNPVTYATAQAVRGLVKSGANPLVLIGDSTYDGGTEIRNGVLQIGDGGGTGTAGTGDILNNGTLTFNRTGALAVPGNISGSGSVTNIGAGTVTLSGANTYGGITVVSRAP